MSEDYKEELKEVRKEIIKNKVELGKGYLAKLISEKKQSENAEISTSFYETSEGVLLEQCFDGSKTYFAIYDPKTGIITYADYYDDNGILIKPIVGEEVSKQHIKLPNKAEEYISDKDLDKEIGAFIRKWLDVDEKYMKFAILNVRKSWVFDKFHSLSYLRALGDYGTGKSRFLDVFGAIHYKPISTSGALTTAVLFRIINKWKGTLIIDEGDWK